MVARGCKSDCASAHCSRDGYIEQASFFFDLCRRIFAHLSREQIFLNASDDDVFVSSIKVINGDNTHNNCADKNLYFSKKPPYNVLLIDLKLSEEQLLEKQIGVRIEIRMKNTKGYQYSQMLDIGFANHNGIGEINKFNMVIQEMDTDAD